MSSREQFEAWYLENWVHTEDHHETMFELSPDDESEYYRLGVRMAHQAWQAATSAMEAKCTALAAELKQSQIDAGCYKKGMEASNERLVQVAAENAGLRDYRPQPSGAAMMEALDAFYEYHEDVPEQGMMAAFEILCCKRPETPATDSFLAEVRAQAKADGVQEYADSFRHSASKIRECHGDTIRVRALLHEASNADEFAAQLRQGGTE